MVCRGIVPFSDQSYRGSDLLVWGIKMSMLCMPLHTVALLSPLSQAQQVGVIDQQPVAGVDVFLGWRKDVPYH